MATPGIAPYNNYTGNGVTTEFSVGFPYLRREFVSVYIKRTDDPQEQVDTSKWEWVNDTTIRFPKQGSGLDVLGEGEILSIRRETPVKSDYLFTNQKRLFPEDVMDADDLEMQILQEKAEEIDRCFRLNQTAEGVEKPDLMVGTIVPNKALKWNANGDGIESSLFDPDEQATAAASSATAASISADSAAASATSAQWYAQNVVFGMSKEVFESTDWQQSGDKYKIFVADKSVISGVYKKNGTKYELVANVDIEVSDTGVTLVSLSAFDGYYLLPDATRTAYTFTQASDDDTWVIEHNLGKKPVVVLVDNTDTVIIGTVKYDSLNQITVTFEEAVSGKAYLS